jgi:hypothetical protein
MLTPLGLLRQLSLQRNHQQAVAHRRAGHLYEIGEVEPPFE